MTLVVTQALTLVVVVAGNKVGKVLSGIDEVLGVTDTYTGGYRLSYNMLYRNVCTILSTT